MSPRQRRVRLILGSLCLVTAAVVGVITLSGGSTDVGDLSRGTPRQDASANVPDARLTQRQRAALEAAQEQAVKKSSNGQAIVSPEAMAAFTARFSTRMLELSDAFSSGAVKIDAKAVAAWLRTKEPDTRVVIETTPSTRGYADSWYVRDVPAGKGNAEPSVEIGLGLPSRERLSRQLPSAAQTGTAPRDERGA